MDCICTKELKYKQLPLLVLHCCSLKTEAFPISKIQNLLGTNLHPPNSNSKRNVSVKSLEYNSHTPPVEQHKATVLCAALLQTSTEYNGFPGGG